MSSRAFRRLQQEAEVIRIRGGLGSEEVEGEEEEEMPGFGKKSKKKGGASNLFALVSHGEQ